MIIAAAGILLAASMNALPAEAAEAPAPACLADGSGFLRARLRGSLDAELDWRAPELDCTGMPRPDGRGMRLRFAGPVPGAGTLAIVFAPPVLAEGASARAVPVNVTLLDEEAGRIFGTLGEGRCLLDEVKQSRLPARDGDPDGWVIEARGFCTGPARALDGAGSVLLTRFDFRGRVILHSSPAARPESTS